MDDGPYSGMQAIIIRPAKSFPFLRLPEEVRANVYRYYFAPKGIVDDPIILEGKRSSNKEIYAKAYADGSEYRVALLAVNHEIHDKALPIFYAHRLKFENTTSLLDFLGQVRDVRPHITSVEIKQYIKLTARPALSILAESPRIKRLHFDAGVFSEGDASKAAKQFHEHAYKFLEAVGAMEKDPEAGVAVLSFSRGAFKYKDDKKVEKSWSQSMVDDFKEALRTRLR